MSARNGTASRLGDLAREAQLLKRHNAELKNAIGLKNSQVQNSLFSLVQAAGAQTSMGSFNNLAYYNIYQPLTINWTMLTYMYKTHGIVQATVDMPVLDAMRGGLEIHSDELDGDDIKDLQDRLENDGILTTVSEAMVWTRLYGGGALIVNTDQDPGEPLDIRKVKKLELYAANRWEIVAPNRHAEYYDFYGEKIHGSRVLTMSGKPAPYIVRWQLQGWGMSEVERMIEDFNSYLRTNDVVYELLKEAKIDVFQFKGFTSQLASAAGTQLTQTRVELMNRMKNYLNAVVMDVDDKFEQKQITFAGLAEVKKENRIGIAAALRIPMTKLFGMSASGFNSGEDDIENYNAMVESEVRTPLRPTVRAVLDLVCQQMFGDSFDIRFNFKPLRVMSSVEEETVKTQKAARYAQNYRDGQITAQEYAQILHMENLMPIETEVLNGAEPEPPEGSQDDSGAADKFGKEESKKAKTEGGQDGSAAED